MRAVLAFMFLLVGATSLSAQTTPRVYVIPTTGTGTPFVDPIRPKYLQEAGVVRSAGLYMQAQGRYLVVADVTAAQHASIAANGDVAAFPANLQAQVGANLATVQAQLEALNLPGAWVQATHTYRQVLFGMATVIHIQQRYAGATSDYLLGAGITLNSTVGDLTVAQRNKLQAVAASFQIDTSSVTLSTTIRQVLRVFAQQLPPMRILDEAFDAQ